MFEKFPRSGATGFVSFAEYLFNWIPAFAGMTSGLFIKQLG
jgi:hypothetical protein